MRGRLLALGLAVGMLGVAVPSQALPTLLRCNGSGSEIHESDMNYSGTVSTTMGLQGTCTLLGGGTLGVTVWGYGSSNFEILNYDGQPDPSIYWRRGVTLRLVQPNGSEQYINQTWENNGVEPRFLVRGPRGGIKGYGWNTVNESLGCQPDVCYSFVAYNWHFLM
ncbi:MAG: hypothetical protein ACRDJ1_02140 [Actinomycetota bacterium]